MDSTTIQASPEAIAYQEHLLGLLGADDPAEVQAGTPRDAALARARGAAPISAPGRSPPSGRCSSASATSSTPSSSRPGATGSSSRTTARTCPGYDQDAWADALHHNDEDPDELLAPFEALRSANLALWRRSSAADRARVGMHRERGPESYDLTFRMIAGHDRFHLKQARETLASLRATGGRP